MYRLVIPRKSIDRVPLPGMGTKSADLWNLGAEAAAQIRQALGEGTLEVHEETEDGPVLEVANVWLDPHNAARMTLFFR